MAVMEHDYDVQDILCHLIYMTTCRGVQIVSSVCQDMVNLLKVFNHQLQAEFTVVSYVTQGLLKTGKKKKTSKRPNENSYPPGLD